jgi:hypothetical protein
LAKSRSVQTLGALTFAEIRHPDGSIDLRWRAGNQTGIVRGLMNRSFWLLLLAATAATSLGCSGNVSRGRALYADGYYVEAAEVFERNETKLGEWPPEKRAAYGLYRSMTLLELGDVAGAARWLHYCEWVQGRTPGALDGEQLQLVAQMHAKLDATEHRDAPPASSAGAVAAQSGQVPGPVSATQPALTPAATPTGAPAPATRKGLVP